MTATPLKHRLSNLMTRYTPINWVRSHANRPTASITFDDFPKSAWTVGGLLLARYGAKATYYAAGGFCGQTESGITYFDADDLRAVVRAGHEIGSHSYAHIKVSTVGNDALRDDAAQNDTFIREIVGDTPLCSYAYPFGDCSPRTKVVMGRRYASARGIRPGINSSMLDLAQLRAIPIECRYWHWLPDKIDALIEGAKAKNGWLIFFTHDVSDQPTPYGCTPSMLEHVLKRLRDEGIDILPVKHAMASAMFGLRRRAAS